MPDTKAELEQIVGDSNLWDDQDTLDAYSCDQSLALSLKPKFLAKPKTTDEVQQLVKWANRTKTPLVPVSSGPPHFHGDTVPSATGAVVVDLSGMKRIIRVDRKNRMAIIEPGVTYSQLQPELAREDLRLASPLLPRANKSVIASLLERQPTLIPRYRWSLPEPLRCLEVVLGTGEILWTGEAGAQPLSLEKQWEKGLAQVDAKGPAETDWHRLVSAAQGSMGIVTWASLRCEILPKVHQLFFIPGENINGLIECTYKLLRVRLGDEFLILNAANLACILGDGTGSIRALKEKLPPWVVIVGVAGREIMPEEKAHVQIEDIRDIVQQCGLRLVPAIPGASGEQMLRVLLQPSKDNYWKLGYKGGCHDIFFLTTLNRTPEFIQTMFSLAATFGYSCSDIGIYIQPQHQGVAHHCEFSLPFDPSNKAEAARVEGFFLRASEELIKQGAYFSRPYGAWADMVYNRDARSRTLLKGIKDILDPNLILNPGKLCF